MPSHQRVILSTTGDITGYNLTRHVGPVSAQFVIGTGVFTDFFSGFTDFFGAGSRSYQKKLDIVERRSLELIRFRAAQAGANGVVGLRIDHDEISGAGKSMLMVTVSGTAVSVIEAAIRSEAHQKQKGAVTPGELSEELEVRRFVARTSGETFRLADWEFVTDNPRKELGPLVLENSARVPADGYGHDQIEKSFERAVDFMAALPVEYAQDLLFGALGREDAVGANAANILMKLDLVDLNQLLQALRSDDVLIRSRAVGAARGHPPLYGAEDVEILAEVVRELRDNYREVAEWSEKKGLVGTSRVWRCPCGTENKEGVEHCARCHGDRFGLKGLGFTPAEVAGPLAERLEALSVNLDVQRDTQEGQRPAHSR